MAASSTVQQSDFKYWQVSPGANESNLWPEFRQASIIAMGWDEMGNLKNYKDVDEMAQKLKKLYPEDYPGGRYLHAGRACPGLPLCPPLSGGNRIGMSRRRASARRSGAGPPGRLSSPPGSEIWHL